MNKTLKTLSVLALGACLFACGEASSTAKPSDKPNATEKTYELKTGSYVTFAADHYDATTFIAEISVANVVLEGDKIVDAKFDVLQAKFGVTADGKIDQKTPDYKTKFELKEAYGMSQAPQGEWYVQNGAFEDWCDGKTIAEVIAAEAKAVTGCTIAYNNYQDALASITDTKTIKTAEAPVAGVGIAGNWVVEQWGEHLEVNIGATVVDADKTILGASVNCYQIPLKVADSKVQLDAGQKQCNADNLKSHGASAKTQVLSKRELKELYGMADAASQGEWNVQADAYADYITGKKIADVKADEEITGCSITHSGFTNACKKAVL